MTIKLLKGLKNIHFAKIEGVGYETPSRILFAKAIENKLKYEGEEEWGDDRLVDSSAGYAGGEGKLNVLGLTKEEQSLLFGNKKVKGGIAVNSSDIAPQGAFLFERGKKNSTHKRLYVVYACQCSPTSFSAETVEEGKGKAGVEEIEYVIGERNDGLIYHYVDTDDSTVDQTTIQNWYTTVQFPKDLTQK